jgi:hypothetical protein
MYWPAVVVLSPHFFFVSNKKIENRTLPVNGVLRRTKRETERESKSGIGTLTYIYSNCFIFVRHSFALLYLPPRFDDNYFESSYMQWQQIVIHEKTGRRTFMTAYIFVWEKESTSIQQHFNIDFSNITNTRYHQC